MSWNSLDWPGSSMPKEQSEHSLCATSSRNAKDKPKHTTLPAVCDAKDAESCSGRGSHCSSEKDSGYSDGSDWQQTDVEDINQSRGSDEPSQPEQTQKLGQGSPGNLSLMSSGHEVSPIYIIKNMVVNQLLSSSSLPHQANTIPKKDQLFWRNETSETSTSGAPHVILLQQPSLLPATVKLHKPLSRHSVRGKNGTSLPVLNSYPRIAPHPSKKPPDKTLLTVESNNLSKMVCSERKTHVKPVTRSDQQLFKQPELAASEQCSSSTTDSFSSSTSSLRTGSHSASSMPSTSSFLITRRLHRNSTASASRHRRFLNTVEILRRSGLLDITLRTKELLRQSNATEQDIAQLRQHTDLLCQAAVSHSQNNVTAWEHLFQTMADSRSYPNLNIQQNVQFHSISIDDTNGAEGAENSGVSPSYLFTSNQKCPTSPQPCLQPREFEPGDISSEKVTLMPPDSSTD